MSGKKSPAEGEESTEQLLERLRKLQENQPEALKNPKTPVSPTSHEPARTPQSRPRKGAGEEKPLSQSRRVLNDARRENLHRRFSVRGIDMDGDLTQKKPGADDD